MWILIEVVLQSKQNELFRNVWKLLHQSWSYMRIGYHRQLKSQFKFGFQDTAILVKFCWNTRLKLRIFHVMSSQPAYLTFCRVYKFLLSFPNVQIQVYLQVDNMWINIEEDIMWKLFWMWCHVQEWLQGEH